MKISIYHISRRGSWRLFSLIIIVFLCSCKKMLEIDPPKSKVVIETVFNNDITATSAMTGIYTEMANGSNFASGSSFSVSSLAGLSADELHDILRLDNSNAEFEDNFLSTNNQYVFGLWQSMYKVIYQANSVLEGLQQSTGVTENTKKQLRGEALFCRSFTYFYLVNLFGDVPLITSTDYQFNAQATRVPTSTIYTQIINDLKEAETNLSAEYFTQDVDFSTPARLRPNKSTANALLSRVFLYLEQWTNAEAAATLVLQNTALYELLQDENQVFLKNSREAIWQLQPISADGFIGQTKESYYYDPNRIYNFNTLSKTLVNSFQLSDQRRINWINQFTENGDVVYYPTKYKQYNPTVNMTEYSMMLRLSEQYLIRAEARSHLNNITGAQSDLNAVRNRANLANTSASTKEALLTAIEDERKFEFFTEWGHRWFDLKRRNRSGAILSVIKGSGWQATDILYPIPQKEILSNTNLKPQNPGY